jgi:DNA-binding protein H-NS
MPRTRISETVGDWAFLNEVVTPETTAGSPHLQQAHAKLQGFLDEVRRLQAEQADYQARKQEATRRINEILEEGRRLASHIRGMLKVEMGIKSEELVRFGIQPFRGRKFAKRPARAAKKSAKRAVASSESPEIPEK